jgi:hypothetical protein
MPASLQLLGLALGDADNGNSNLLQARELETAARSAYNLYVAGVQAGTVAFTAAAVKGLLEAVAKAQDMQMRIRDENKKRGKETPLEWTRIRDAVTAALGECCEVCKAKMIKAIEEA